MDRLEHGTGARWGGRARAPGLEEFHGVKEGAVFLAEIVDVVLIGMGSGGEAAAGELAEADLAVVGIEGRLVGGECPSNGCIPGKMMIRAGNSLAEGRRIRGLAGDANIRPDWAPVAERIRSEATDNWDDTVAVDRLTSQGGRFLRGRARSRDPGRSAQTAKNSPRAVPS